MLIEIQKNIKSKVIKYFRKIPHFHYIIHLKNVKLLEQPMELKLFLAKNELKQRD
mgnify:CR=1 FL=1